MESEQITTLFFEGEGRPVAVRNSAEFRIRFDFCLLPRLKVVHELSQISGRGEGRQLWLQIARHRVQNFPGFME